MPTNKTVVDLNIMFKIFGTKKICVINTENNEIITEYATIHTSLVGDIEQLSHTYTIRNVNLYGNKNYLSKFVTELNPLTNYNLGMKINIIEK